MVQIYGAGAAVGQMWVRSIGQELLWLMWESSMGQEMLRVRCMRQELL